MNPTHKFYSDRKITATQLQKKRKRKSGTISPLSFPWRKPPKCNILKKNKAKLNNNQWCGMALIFNNKISQCWAKLTRGNGRSAQWKSLTQWNETAMEKIIKYSYRLSTPCGSHGWLQFRNLKSKFPPQLQIIAQICFPFACKSMREINPRSEVWKQFSELSQRAYQFSI